MQTDEMPANSVIDRVGRSWGFALRDVFLIVVSILIAFGLDAWWSGRIARQEGRSALAAVRADFRAARIELDSVVAINEADVRAITTLLSMDPVAVQALDADSAASLVTQITDGGLTFDPSMGAVQALLSSGSLGQVRNQELAAALAAWPGVLNEIGEDQGFLTGTWVDLRDWAARRGLLTSVLAVGGYPSVSATASPQEILIEMSDSGRGLLAAQLWSLGGLLHELEDVSGRLNHLLDLLDAELAEH